MKYANLRFSVMNRFGSKEKKNDPNEMGVKQKGKVTGGSFFFSKLSELDAKFTSSAKAHLTLFKLLAGWWIAAD